MPNIAISLRAGNGPRLNSMRALSSVPPTLAKNRVCTLSSFARKSLLARYTARFDTREGQKVGLVEYYEVRIVIKPLCSYQHSKFPVSFSYYSFDGTLHCQLTVEIHAQYLEIVPEWFALEEYVRTLFGWGRRQLPSPGPLRGARFGKGSYS